MNSDNNSNGTPQLRFPGFTGEWEEKKFKDITFPVGKKNKQNFPYERYSISNEVGFYPQSSQFEDGGGYLKDIDCRQYIIVPPKSFAYNPARINVGSIGYQNLGKDVIVSSLYEVFQAKEICDDIFLWHWFHSGYFHKMVVDVQEGGVRQYFFYEKLKECSIYLPSLAEQEKIAACLSEMDALIAAQWQKVEALKERKQGLMQQLFPRPGETTPRLRFPGFTGEWEEKEFGKLIQESKLSSKEENEDVLLTSAIDGMFLNSEKFSHQRGKSTIGYRKIKKGMLVLSAQNLHLGNANVNLRFDSGLVSPAYKVYTIVGCLPEFMAQWIKRDATKEFFLRATTQGASECRKNVVWEQLYKQTIPVPNNDAEQRIIADFLSQMDAQIVAQSQKLEVLQAHKRGLMQQMFPNPNK